MLGYDDACETEVDEWTRVEEESDREVGRIVSLFDEGREEDGGEELDDDIVYNESTRIGGNDNQGGAENLVNNDTSAKCLPNGGCAQSLSNSEWSDP